MFCLDDFRLSGGCWLEAEVSPGRDDADADADAFDFAGDLAAFCFARGMANKPSSESSSSSLGAADGLAKATGS